MTASILKFIFMYIYVVMSCSILLIFTVLQVNLHQQSVVVR